MVFMTERMSQNVRLKEEMVRALVNYAKPRGVTMQHVASVGAWFYMCLPDAMVTAIGKAFYEWCKSPTFTPDFPAEIDPILQKAIETMKSVYREEESRRSKEEDPGFTLADLIDFDPDDRGAAADKIEAEEEDARTKQKKADHSRGKTPKTG